jgi:hypothetical protein
MRLRINSRVERLERTLGVTDRAQPLVHQINFIDSDGSIAGTMVISNDPKLSKPYVVTPGYEKKV